MFFIVTLRRAFVALNLFRRIEIGIVKIIHQKNLLSCRLKLVIFEFHERFFYNEIVNKLIVNE